MSNLPRGPRLASLVQLFKWVYAPLPFMDACAVLRRPNAFGRTVQSRRLSHMILA